MNDLCEFVVEGTPRPAGGLRIIPGKGGRRPFLAPASSKTLNKWKKVVKAAAKEAYDGKPYAGPVGVDLRFYMSRPKAHSTMKGMRPEAPMYPTSRAVADFDKLTRAACDCLSGIVIVDDCQIVDARIAKRYADGRVVGATIRVYTTDNEEDLRLELEGFTS